MTDLLKNTVLNTLKIVIPTEQVADARETRKNNLKSLNFSEKINYKLHDKTSWMGIGMVAYFVYSKDYLNAFNELINLIGA